MTTDEKPPKEAEVPLAVPKTRLRMTATKVGSTIESYFTNSIFGWLRSWDVGNQWGAQGYQVRVDIVPDDSTG